MKNKKYFIFADKALIYFKEVAKATVPKMKIINCLLFKIYIVGEKKGYYGC